MEGERSLVEIDAQRNVRNLLSFLTDDECNELATQLRGTDEEGGHARVSIIRLKSVLKLIGWLDRREEVVRRLQRAVQHGLIDYSSLCCHDDVSDNNVAARR